MFIKAIRVFVFFFFYTVSVKVHAYDQDLMIAAKNRDYPSSYDESDLKVKDTLNKPEYVSFEDYAKNFRRLPASDESSGKYYFNSRVLNEIPLDTSR